MEMENISLPIAGQISTVALVEISLTGQKQKKAMQKGHRTTANILNK